MHRIPRSALLVLALTMLVGLAGLHYGARTVSADGIASVSCSGTSSGLNDCTVTLGAIIAPGGTISGTLTNPNAMFIACNTIPAGGQCSITSNTVTFSCVNGCSAGTVFRDVVQLTSGSGSAQTFTGTGATVIVASTPSTTVVTSSSGLPSPSTAVFPVSGSTSTALCFTTQGTLAACGSIGATTVVASNGCVPQSFVLNCSGLVASGVPSCLTALGISSTCSGFNTFGGFGLNGFGNCFLSGAGFVNGCNSVLATPCSFAGQPIGNLCTNCTNGVQVVNNVCSTGCFFGGVAFASVNCNPGFVPGAFPANSCVALGPNGIVINQCGVLPFTNGGLFGGNCFPVLQTLSGPVIVPVCPGF